MNDNNLDPEVLVAILRRQLDIYRRLERLSLRQKTLITSDDSRQLLVLLAERQKLVDTLTSLNQSLVPLQKQWPSLRKKLSQPLRAQVDELLAEAAQVLQGILHRDAEGTRLLAGRKAQVAKQSEALAVNRRAFKAYGAETKNARRRLISTDESA